LTGTGAASTANRVGRRNPVWCRRLPEDLTIWVPLLLSAAHLVSFSLWTIWISFTPSTLVPVSGWVGLRNYTAVMASRNWQIAFDNLLLFGSAFVLLSLVTGLMLAILLDQRIRGENSLRSIFLYPLAVSFVVTGTVWSWLLNPGFGIQKLVHDLGWTSFRFDWLVDRDMASGRSYRRDLAILGLRHGALPRRPSVRRCRHHQGRADRRRWTDPDLLARHSADALADHHHRRRRSSCNSRFRPSTSSARSPMAGLESRPSCRPSSSTT
jgi:hypothetical protein